MHHRLSLFIIRSFLTFVALAGCAFAQIGVDGRPAFDDSATVGAEMPSPMRPHKMIHNGTLAGTIRDSTGKPIKDARIEVQSRETGQIVFSGYTAQNGSFAVPNLPTGSYEVVVSFGLTEARESVILDGAEQEVSLYLPGSSNSDTGDKNSVSVAQMRVPQQARNAYRKAQEAMHKDKPADAEKYVEEALHNYPRYADALTLRGILRLDEKKYDEATRDLEQAIQYDPNYPVAYVALGATYNLLSRWDDALRVLIRGTTLNPSAWQGYFEMGKSYMGKGDYQAALQQLAKTEQLQPQYSLVHLVKAHALLGLKDYTNAMAELEVYLEHDPTGENSQQARETLDKVRAFTAANHLK
jgi:Tfp pilus assembly protein PilF